jgi:hypothetical protein
LTDNRYRYCLPIFWLIGRQSESVELSIFSDCLKPIVGKMRTLKIICITRWYTLRYIVDFKSLSKLGANFATKFVSSFQCLNFVCKQMFILNNNNNRFNEINLLGSPLDQELSIELLISTWTMNICLQYSSNIEIYFIVQTLFRSSRPSFELGNVTGKFATNLETARWKVTWNRQFNNEIHTYRTRFDNATRIFSF